MAPTSLPTNSASSLAIELANGRSCISTKAGRHLGHPAPLEVILWLASHRSLCACRFIQNSGVVPSAFAKCSFA